MTHSRRKEILIESIDSLKAEMLELMDKRPIPQEWDGIEMRQWVAEYFHHHMSVPKRVSNFSGYSQRRKDFKNHIYSNNLI